MTVFTVESEINIGTTFKALIPSAMAERSVAETRKPVERPRGGTETILVVEDEEGLRRVVRSGLEHFGYRVVVAETAVVALRKWQECKDEVQLVLSDVIMPDGLSGQDLAKILRAEAPKLPIILTTGYPDRVNLEVDGPNLKLLRKPYDLPNLLRIVRETLDIHAATP